MISSPGQCASIKCHVSVGLSPGAHSSIPSFIHVANIYMVTTTWQVWEHNDEQGRGVPISWALDSRWG